MDNKKVGKFIAQLRGEYGYSQKELAERLNVTDKAVSKWETGRGMPEVSLLVPIADELGVSVTELLEGKRLDRNETNGKTVEMIKSGKKRIVLSVLITAVLILISLSVFPIYHYFSSVTIDDKAAVENLANDTLDTKQLRVVKSQSKAEYYVYLVKNPYNAFVITFKQDDIFKSRMNYCGLSPCENGDLGLYSFGERGNNVNIFSGYNVKYPRYTFSYKGVKYICPVDIRDGYVLDIFIDNSDTYTNPTDFELLYGMSMYTQSSDGYWSENNQKYKYKVELTGTLPNAKRESTYIVLTNNEHLTFEDVSKCFYSSNSDDFLDPSETVIVEVQ